MLLQVTRAKFVIDEVVDGGMFATELTRCSLAGLDVVELHGLGIEGEQTVGEQFAHFCEVFECLCRLYGAEHASYSSQHTSLRTCGHSPWWWRFLEHASVARCTGQVSESLSGEAQNASVGEWFASHDTRIVDEKLDREVVSAVDNEIVFPDDVESIGRVEKLMEGVNLHVGVDSLNFLLGTVYLSHSHILGEMDNLSLEIAQVDLVGIYDAYGANAGSSKIERDGSSETASTHYQHACVHYLLLSFHTHVLEQDVARIALYLLFGEVYHIAPPPMK